ncbi:transcriptional regulator, DeoR family [Granulicatella balaenopterae]|uniref:Lactose phosphotransferase system repressor n=1 Tax=Granulicatella balaenopterae TaxID=137733 RepID=A0A1H9LL59_9LACT|nr:DeoR/GlpR family DNA-binding transcription regulator [Granulicatella balaenopterae]SER12154.1 transcriptional regulator, DeoR family [Granulicatella balaenopterae]
MLKRERILTIIEKVNQSGIVTINDLVDQLEVSDMTIRRDLDELAEAGKLVRIHGGAQKITLCEEEELTHLQKMEIHLKEKEAVAKIAASFIKHGDTIYLGPGTTLELMAKYVTPAVYPVRIITNSLPVFQSWEKLGVEVLLIGGIYRSESQSFVGSLANETLNHLKFTKAFVGVNGIYNESVMNANIEEGQIQAIALNNAFEKIIVADKYKFNRNDFYQFYDLDLIDKVITNQELSEENISHYETYTKIIV